MNAILTYHSVDPSGSPISVDPAGFRAHVRFLASGRVQVAPLSGLFGPSVAPNTVALTFDDGYANFETDALPLLVDYGLPATLFVVSEHAGRTNAWENDGGAGIPVLPLMNWTALGRAMARGVEIGAHSRKHCDLTTLDASVLEDEIAGCAADIARELGVRPTTFAYPFGRFTSREATMVGAAYDRACTTEFRPLRHAEDMACLPRLDMYYFRQKGQLEAWGSPTFRRRLWLRAQGRRVRQFAANAGFTR